MKKAIGLILIILVVFTINTECYAENSSNWTIDAGIRGFKFSADGNPNEIDYNPVFARWENINRDLDGFTVNEYEPLEPLYFNMNLGIDLFIRYKKYLLIKVGYDYSNPFGIGGSGNISYVDNSAGIKYHESKDFSYTSHQVNLFFGPLVPVDDGKAEIYLGFSPMPPTWVKYSEKYTRTRDGSVENTYDKKFTGMFGSCRALIGIQVKVSEKLYLGSEAVFTVLNYMNLESGDLQDNSFQFPGMKWNFTARYRLY